MSVLTVYADDGLSAAIHGYAEEIGQSVNTAMNELLSKALRLVKRPMRNNDFSAFCGILRKGDADEIRANLVQCDTIDAELWK